MTNYAPAELYRVLESFKPALKSVDLRCVAVSTPSEEYWQNLIISIFLSDKTVDEVKKEQKTIPQIRNNYFALFYDAIPFEYNSLTKIAEGNFRIPVTNFGGNRIQFRKSDIFKLKIGSSQEWIEGSYAWMLKTADSGSNEERKELWSIVDEQSILSKQFNFDSIPKMIEHYLRIRYSNNERKDIEIVIYPPPATIENLEFRDNHLEVILKKTSKLNGLQLNLSVLRGTRKYGIITREITSEKTEFKNNPEIFETRKLLPLDMLYADLIHRDSGLTLDSTYKRVPLENISEPFLKTLDAF